MARVKLEREFYWKRHLATLIITLIIFSFGILIGSNLSEERIEFTKADI